MQIWTKMSVFWDSSWNAFSLISLSVPLWQGGQGPVRAQESGYTL